MIILMEEQEQINHKKDKIILGVQVTLDDKKLIEDYAASQRIPVAALVRQLLFEKIKEDSQ